MAEDNTRQGFNSFIIPAVMFFITVLLVCVFSYLKGMNTVGIISNTVMSGIGMFTVLLFMAQAGESDLYEYDNKNHLGRFFLFYLTGLMLAISCSYLPVSGWPFIVIYVALSLFSNTLIGIASGTLLLMISVLLSGSGMEVFILYFVCGLAGASLFRGLNDAFKIGIPVVVSALFLLTGQTAGIVLFTNESLKIELFLIPIMNIVITVVLLLIILKIFSSLVIHRYRDKYMEINDPEFELLVELKNSSKDDYYKVVHIAYFCERIAKKLSLDAEATKAAGYYHKIGILFEEDNWVKVDQIAQQNKFPPAVRQILKEYMDKNTPVKQKETAILVFSDAVVSSILFLLARKQSQNLNYDQIIDTVFKQKMETSLLLECSISIDKLNQMKNIFKEEKLYYDFLR